MRWFLRLDGMFEHFCSLMLRALMAVSGRSNFAWARYSLLLGLLLSLATAVRLQDGTSDGIVRGILSATGSFLAIATVWLRVHVLERDVRGQASPDASALPPLPADHLPLRTSLLLLSGPMLLLGHLLWVPPLGLALYWATDLTPPGRSIYARIRDRLRQTARPALPVLVPTPA